MEKKEGEWKIVEENWMSTGSSADTKASVDPTRVVNAQFSNWLKAWVNQDINAYLSFYSNQFKSSKGNHSRWKTLRRHALKANTNLSIQVSNIQVSHDEEMIELNFIQTFQSDNHSDVGIKELVWERNGNDWKILKETWLSS